jgi:DNA-binding GntR family transcriptional regulator
VEDEIIARTEATRHAVRRAFDELERMGLAIRQPNKGVQVRDYSIGEIEELYEIRECLESRAASRFTGPADPQALETDRSMAIMA